MSQISLRVRYDDVLDVYRDDERVGEVAFMSDGWAAYRLSASGMVVERRLGTYPNIEKAVEGLVETLASA